MMNPLVSNPVAVDETLAVNPLGKEKFIKIYPNPTADIFTVECSRAGSASPVQIDIYSMEGKHIASTLMSGGSKQQFSLSGMPMGLYMIHARSANQTEIAKIVKY